MAEIVENEKKFKIVRMSRGEVAEVFGTVGICDRCNTKSEEGYYIAILNMWMCPDCYKQWLKTAIHYEEDKPYEERCYRNVLRELRMI